MGDGVVDLVEGVGHTVKGGGLQGASILADLKGDVDQGRDRSNRSDQLTNISEIHDGHAPLPGRSPLLLLDQYLTIGCGARVAR